MDAQPPHKHLRLAYILISIILFLPVLLWPIPILLFENPMLTDKLTPTWLLSATLLLFVVMGMDTMLYGVSSFKQAIDATLWIALFAMIAVSTLQNQNNAWPLAALFFIHSLRSAFYLFKKKDNDLLWWTWLAWSRDITTSLTLFFWATIS